MVYTAAPHRHLAHQLVTGITPHDETEAAHQREAARWIRSGAPLYRDAEKTVDPHLCVYFVPYDEKNGSVLLIDHIKAGRWLFPGGHVDPKEDPRETVRRETAEELGAFAQFHPLHGPMPFFININKTRPPSNCTDITLWFIISLSQDDILFPDPREMRDLRWPPLADRAHWELASDEHMSRFLDKFQAALAAAPS